ncbi:sulfotransferase family 2 domain-containing protein [Tritonibacter mobilis]|uniref:sulfotransferase family 2 domain-containing protein n=1 Tax=Tritonibacter mobilis TaxID=379347 RepID=UPI001C093D1E|nr:sulfotransferase family 2 domain-containing protein [Tritonibacter mobilis]MBU3036015.1 sulfotransferase family protein [Tritonibacter mobilis]WHQ85269.1 sulfotransferase family 2 domain-containing protein [Tritonibacter mobilis]
MIQLRQHLRDALPEPIHRAQLAIRRAALMRRAEVIFIHIPKNAGFSINLALYGRFMGHYTAREVARYCPGTWRRLPSFALTRNPWERCLSAYRFAIQTPTDPSASKAQIAHPHRYTGVEFASFKSFVQEWLPAEPLSRRDQVFRPQVDYVTDKAGQQIVDFIGRVDAMAEVEIWLTHMLGKPIEIGHENRSAGAAPANYRHAYDDQTAEIVSKLYAQDIQRFGYKF